MAKRDSSPDRGAGPWRAGWVAGGLVAAVVLVYANTLRVPFLLDDRSSVVENASLRDLGAIGAVLQPTGTPAGRPLLNLSFALNYAAGGLSPVGYHAVNLAIHALAALALFGLLRRTLASARMPGDVRAAAPPLAALVALLWAVHPLQTNAVTYVSQRAESMMGLCYLLALYCFARAVTATRAALWFAGSIAAAWAGVMTKEVAMTLPVMVLLYDRVFVSDSFLTALRRRKTHYAFLAASWVLLAVLAVCSHLGERDVGLRAGSDWYFYALTEFKVIVLYVKLALWPSPLVFDYGREILVHDWMVALPYAVAVIVALGVTIGLFVRGRLALALVAASFFILLSPTSSFVPVVGQPMAESRLYLPLAAILILVVLGLHRWLKGGAWYAGFALAIALGALTVSRNGDFRSSLGIWEDTVRKQPDNSRAQYNFANELVKDPARAGEARAHYEAALRLMPDLAEAHHNLANELAKLPGHVDEALRHYDEAARLKPELAEARFNAARLLDTVPTRLPEAIFRWEQAVKSDPDNPEGHFRLANDLLQISGQEAAAMAEYETALRLKPDFAAAHHNLANVLAQQPGQLAAAIEHYEAALRLRPDDAEAHCNLANKLARLPGRMDDALAHYEAALRLKPDFLEAHYNYANRLSNLPGRLPDAVAHYEAAERINPRVPEVHKNLALALANLGRFDDAVRELGVALELRPNYPEARDLLERIQAAR